MSEQDHTIQETLDQLSVLAPHANEQPQPPQRALAQLHQKIEAQQQTQLGARLRAWLTPPAPRLAWTAVFLLMLGLLFTIPGVRAAASDFLGLFRVQKFTAVSISPDQIAMLQQIAAEGVSPGELRLYQEPGQASAVASLAAAATRTGLSPVRTIPTLGPPAQIWVMDGGNGRFDIDLAGARTIVAAAGADPALLPDALENGRILINVFAGVQQQWANGAMLMQTESPLVEYPNGVDPALLGTALLQALGMSANEAARIASQIDWTSTLLLPIPSDMATFNEVTVNGSSGLALTSLDGAHAALLWQENGVIYLLTGRMGMAELLALARQVQ